MGAPEIYLLNRDFERIAVLTEYESLVWTSRIWDHSEARLKCAPGSIPASAAFFERSDTDEAMWIRRVHDVSEDTERYTELAAWGATLMFDKRVNWWTKEWAGVNLAVAVEELLADAQITYAGLDRTIDGMSTTLVDLTGTPHLISKQVSWGQVAAIVYDIVRAAGFSFGVRYASAAGLKPFVRRGVDLSASVVFSTAFDDVSAAEADFDLTDAANVAVVGGQGEGPARIVTTVTVDDGEELAELWVDADDLEQGELTAGEYLDLLAQRGAEKLADLPVTMSVEGVVTEDRYTYRDDFDLGDTVTFEAFGLAVTDTVSEVTETIEDGKRRIELSLGTTAPTIRKLLR